MKRGKRTVLPRNGPAWFALHCLEIIQPGEEPSEGLRITHLRRFEGSSLERIYVAAVRKLLRRHDVYSLFRYFPYIRDAGYGKEFKDAEDGKKSLSRGVFEWLVSIRPSNLVYQSGDICYLEPYVLSRFARQFRYN